jgi:hypothetical protein
LLRHRQRLTKLMGTYKFVSTRRGRVVTTRRCIAKARRRAVAWTKRFRSAFVAWLAVLAVLMQLGSAAQHPAVANPAQSDAVAALDALTALLGPHVVLCEHDDGSAPGSPAHDPRSCCDCALCQLTGHAAALLPPDTFLTAQFALHGPPLVISNERSLAKPHVVAFAQPRAPPNSA